MLSFNVGEAIEFSEEKRVRKAIFKEASMKIEMLCYLPGQAIPLHHHPKEDEVFYIVDGEPLMTVDGEERKLSPNDLMFVPANSKHSISNPGPGKLVAVFFKADRPLPEAPSP
ncbi:MAG: cupin domain-containing protein [Dehalococcoidia bacterium]|nr:cupin domain-containing protein [Dehalococcoidia bacterium]